MSTKPFDLSSRALAAIHEIHSMRPANSPKEDFTRGDAYLPPLGKTRLIHLVMQGGGTLGIAHLGFVRGLEAAGFRFAGLAGTSAGAIVSLLIACCRASNPEPEVSGRLLPLLVSMPASAFMDGPFHARRFVKFVFNRRGASVLEYILPGVTAWRRLVNDHGLHKGDRFLEWLQRTLDREFGVKTVAQLEAHLSELAATIRLNASGRQLLHIVATAMPMGLKVVFPHRAEMFNTRYREQSPAIWARASMSVPLFFEPFRMDLNPLAWKTFLSDELQGHYAEKTIEEMGSLSELYFIDGGLLSNFPIDAFDDLHLGLSDRSTDSVIETIGIALVPGARNSAMTGTRGSVRALFRHAAAVAGAVRHARDFDALDRSYLRARHNPSAPRTHVTFIDTGEHNWLNFNLDQDAMEDLYLRGLRTCVSFLNKASLEKKRVFSNSKKIG